MADLQQPELRVGDLVDVPVVRTVVRLHDAEDDAQSNILARDFVFTEDVVRSLRVLSRSFAQGEGAGFFLIGSYGSGKSHLLAVLSLWCELGPRAELRLPDVEPMAGLQFCARMALEAMGLQQRIDISLEVDRFFPNDPIAFGNMVRGDQRCGMIQHTFPGLTED